MQASLWGILASIVAAVPSAGRVELSQVAGSGQQFVELLSKEDFAGAVTRFDAAMFKALPEPKLRETWQTIQSQNGVFQKQLGARATKVAGYDVALVTCRFERTTLDVKVVFKAEGKVAGLFFLAPDAGPPPYARPKAFHERDFIVGRGEWQLPGTLAVPHTADRPSPAVVLVHGSGPSDRDETVGGNKPFRDLAMGLASRGIAVLRYEKRTRQYPGKWASSAEQFTVQTETINDALTAVDQLRTTEGIDPDRIFVLGHSLGGIMAPQIGESDPQIAGLIIMAGCLSRPLEDVWIERGEYLLSLKDTPSAEEQVWLKRLKSDMAKVKKLTAADASSSEVLQGATPAYWLSLRQYDALATVKQVKQPILVLQGGRDYQTGLVDFENWKQVLDRRPKVTFKLYRKLNHLFIAGEGKCTPEEYLRPGHVANGVVADIANWIQGL